MIAPHNPRTGLRALRPVLALAALLAATSCGGRSGAEASAEAAGGGPTGPNPTLRTVELRAGDASILAEVALTPGERERGLMFRKSLPEGRGMLFVFEADQRLAFWMKNTTLPLSIAYISADGVIREIRDLEPLSLAPVEAERSVRYALETPRGWFDRVGLKAGDRFAIPRF
ncbi:MAG: DUF192 domain-containing protein [Spirochaetaceae bacterium]|nr:DUF192 domain-containing protein [Spirochaetaceae bacterium]